MTTKKKAVDDTGSKVGVWLDELQNKYGDFEVANSFRGSDGEKQFTKYRKWLAAREDRRFNNPHHRTILDVEVVIDIDENAQFLEKLKLDSIIKKIESDGMSYTVWNTGSRGHHIHMIFPELRDYAPDVIKMTKEKIIERYHGELMKSSQRCMIAVEYQNHFKTGTPKKLVQLRNCGINRVPNEILDFVKLKIRSGGD